MENLFSSCFGSSVTVNVVSFFTLGHGFFSEMLKIVGLSVNKSAESLNLSV